MNTSEAKPTRQFTVRYLLALTAFVAVCLLPVAYLGALGLIASVAFCVAGVLAFYGRYGAATIGLLLVFYLMLPAVNSPTSRRRSACINNVRNIALALGDYEADHGDLPPPYTMDDEGRPLHSWRVLILPYLQEDVLYESIDLTKPWDDPVNLALATEMPSCYRCPRFKPNAPDLQVTTSYVAVVGDSTAWPQSGGRKMSDITDGAPNTLAIVESEKHRLHWMSTEDPGIEMITNADMLLANETHNKSGGTYARCDASVGYLASDILLSDLLALIKIDDGDAVPKE